MRLFAALVPPAAELDRARVLAAAVPPVPETAAEAEPQRGAGGRRWFRRRGTNGAPRQDGSMLTLLPTSSMHLPAPDLREVAIAGGAASLHQA